MNNKVEGIHYLRAIAAILVVIFHLKLSLPEAAFSFTFGYAGVDIFFVISGFVMAHSTRNLHLGATLLLKIKSALEFMRRRALRIVPLYYIGLMVASRKDLLDGVISLNLIKDLIFFPHQHATYIDILRPTLIQGWTLNYEMFFYGLFALSILFGALRKYVLVGILVTLTVIGFYVHKSQETFYYWNNKSIFSFFYTDTLIIEFALGMLAQQLFVKFKDNHLSHSALVVVTVMSSLSLMSNAHHEYGYRGITLGIPAFLIVLSVSFACIGVKNKTLDLLGDASYAIYLFHFFAFGALTPLRLYVHQHMQDKPTVVIGMLILIYFVFAVGSGILIHLWIEKPLLSKIQNWGKRLTAPHEPINTSRTFLH